MSKLPCIETRNNVWVRRCRDEVACRNTSCSCVGIVNKTPFVATIAVAADNRTYSVNATAPKDILSKFTASVKDSVLTLSTSGSIILTSDKKANLTVRCV